MFETGLKLLSGGAEEVVEAAERSFTVPGPLVSFSFDLFGYTVKVTEMSELGLLRPKRPVRQFSSTKQNNAPR